ncbi:hypothetical protein FNV43_RR16777 [Rhamnella rubrinervis]|uniref:Uncharacterized protein n=1 Tax=Rhamnella rubrinervis TaxID=2594499 RepID=A0A8K0GZE5_9ROSA|nr:hypothetical protein FNV43_RR16777 [Rhamnella rubrinervis]
MASSSKSNLSPPPVGSFPIESENPTVVIQIQQFAKSTHNGLNRIISDFSSIEPPFTVSASILVSSRFYIIFVIQAKPIASCGLSFMVFPSWRISQLRDMINHYHLRNKTPEECILDPYQLDDNIQGINEAHSMDSISDPLSQPWYTNMYGSNIGSDDIDNDNFNLSPT